jgi:hypothetical protein
LTQAEVRSTTLQVLANGGNIALAPVLNDSTIQIPVEIRLNRSLGDQIGLVNSDTPTNAQYVALPDFLTMRGTIGAPKSDLDKRALLLIAAKAGGGIGKNIGGVAGQESQSVFNAVEGLLGTKSTAGTNSATKTNTPVSDLLNLFKKSK